MTDLRTDFTVERERPPVVNDAGELEDQEPEILTFTAIWYVEPAENGGRESPSWAAYPEVESIVDSQGREVSSDRELMVAADNAVNAAFNEGSADPDYDYD